MPERGAAAAERNGTYMQQKKWPLRLLSGGLVTAALVGVAVAAGQQGSQSDPLVTLSYLQQQALPQVLEKVDEKVAARQSELEDKLSAVADGYAAEVEAALSGSAGAGSGSQTGGAVYRHPSQLYEAVLEGVVIFVVLYALSRRVPPRPQGTFMGAFLALYGVFRFLVEFVRVPDAQLGYLFGPITMGQLLSLPLVLLGIVILVGAHRLNRPQRGYLDDEPRA